MHQADLTTPQVPTWGSLEGFPGAASHAVLSGLSHLVSAGWAEWGDTSAG